MAKWQRTIKLNPEWDQANDGEISYSALAASIHAKLKAIELFNDEDIDRALNDLTETFAWLAESAATCDDIDNAMHDLYEWGDTSLDDEWNGKKVCFIDTFSPVKAVQ